MDKFPFPINLDRDSPIPIYKQLSSAIIQAIHDGKLNPNQRLPSENEFARQYGIVPMTVRQAMNELVRAGFIYRVQGRGTFVAPRFLEHGLERMLSFSEDMRARNLIPGSKILSFEHLSPPDRIAELLNITNRDLVIHVKRLRLANNQPVGVHDAWIARVLFEREELEESGSLYHLLARKEVYLSDGDDLIQSVEADEELSGLLGIRVGAALLRITRLARDHAGRPIEYVEASYRADLYRYSVHLRR
ncbi:GntR family transcriptional regulator [Thermanaerothrix sp. 4228-RoL]|jgi:GntR family transcriptional regulator|uniref:GntR family transcriptional regulator n=1 Tax=Thermanaerothrix solaris TaxID=3058434 RepID=A0ABU3NRK5_9CHLR|nr:GntR family transcriptional regulator [Thermanaerothrix sp. 4228-RoL]MDT8899439.1 GntR family transcriptional regulator [Thermanaerothrix sp. 4228-RoL]